MDKKNTVLGVVLLLAAFALMFYGRKTTPPPPPAPQIGKPATVSNPLAGNQAPGPATSALPATSPSDATLSSLSNSDQTAKFVTLANDFIEVRFVDFGGAIESVALKKYPAVKDKPDPFVFNREHTDPILAFTQDSFPGADRSVHYSIVSQNDHEIVFRAIWQNRLEITRRYVLPPSDIARKQGDPYQIYHETTFRNLTGETQPVPHFDLGLGTAAPVNPSDFIYISAGYDDGKKAEFIERSKMENSGFMGIGAKPPTQKISNNSPIAWAAIEDQFFCSILTPDTPGTGFVTRRLEFPPLPGTTRPAQGMTAAAGFDVSPLAANAQAKVGMSLYVGPKEFERLSNQDVFKTDQEKVMRFGSFFGIFSRILLIMMSKVHHWVGNWGWAIIITTLVLRTIFIPFTLAASKSSKRMQAIQPQLKELREKYKDNPTKLNQATMALFKENRVNPAGGCLPMLVTIPFFWGFYDMLRHTSELRFAEFLWCRDLSAPDTVAHVAGFALNVFPILLTVVMFLQMHFTPQPSVDSQQAKLMKYMPVGMGLLYYNFSSALSVYSTVNGLFMMGQQFIINRMKDAPAPAPATKNGPSGRPIKNVTPPPARKK